VNPDEISLSFNRTTTTYKSGKKVVTYGAVYEYEDEDTGKQVSMTWASHLTREKLFEVYQDYCRQILNIERRSLSFGLWESFEGEEAAK